MATASGSPEKEGYVLVQFTHGDPSDPEFERYTNYSRDVESHTSTPAMELDIPENTGTLEKKELKILLPRDDFTEEISNGLPHSPIFVSVEEVTTSFTPGDEASRNRLFYGQVENAIRNYQGRGDTVGIFALPIKSRLGEITLGLQCNHHCANRLFSPGCGLSQALHDRTGEIATIDGKEITIVANAAITNPTAPGGDNSRYWERGYLRKDGLRISIFQWSISDPTVFILRRRPPSDWALAGNNSILFVPGCHKTIEDCRAVWDNEQGQAGSGGFLGLGYSMLPYNPIIESPQ